jgi:hypothetical protein
MANGGIMPSSLARRALAAVFASALPLIALTPACNSSKLEPKECDKIRGEAFDLINKGQQCSVDGDCKQSDWPGCAKPISKANDEKLRPMSDAYKKGQCEEPKVDCKPPPEVYCKQGLCVHREKGVPENMGPATGDIQIK